MRLIQV